MPGIYSVPLGAVSETAAGSYVIYTVPLGGGPAILRSSSIQCEAGASGLVYVTVGGVSVGIQWIDNTLGAERVVETLSLYQPLNPGDSIHLYVPAAGSTNVVCGGYQFSTP